MDTNLVQKIKGLGGAYGREQAGHARNCRSLDTNLTLLTVEVLSAIIDTSAYDKDESDARLLHDAKIVLLRAASTSTVAEIDAALAHWQRTNDALLCLSDA